jgi:hypothetical protein
MTTKLSNESLAQFRESHRIATTGKDKNGGTYSTIGCLNQAAWIGERANQLLDEIDRLRDYVGRARGLLFSLQSTLDASANMLADLRDSGAPSVHPNTVQRQIDDCTRAAMEARDMIRQCD